MSIFNDGIKNFFNRKGPAPQEVISNKKESKVSEFEDARLVDTTELDKEIIAALDKIRQEALSPADIDGLSEEKTLEAEQIVKEAEINLEAAKKEGVDDIEKVQKLTFTVGVVDTTDALRGTSYRAASEKMTADKKTFLRKIWSNYTEQYQHEKHRVGIKQEMIKENNLFVAEDLSEDEKVKAQEQLEQATLARFLPEIEGLVEEKLGEKREVLEDNKETENIKTDLKKIMNDYADGKLDEAGFEGAKREVFAAIENNKNQETIKKSEMYADNFLEIAQQVKEIKDNIRLAADHQEKLAQFDFEINLILGKAKEGIKTETHYNSAERTVEKLRQTRLGSLVNETTLAAGVGLTYSAISFMSQRLARSKALAYGTLGASALVSGVYAGVKEGQMQKRERQTLEVRDVTQTATLHTEANKLAQDISALEAQKQATSDKKELKKIEKNIKNLKFEQEKLTDKENLLYEKKTANDLIDGLEISDKSPLDSGEQIDKFLNNLADIEARLGISNEKKIDLISYSSLVNVESERQQLLKAKWEAKAKLGHLPADVSADWEKKLLDLTEIHRQQLLDDEKRGVNKVDADFKKYKNKKILAKVAQNTISGLVVGLAAQEVFAAFSDTQEGLAENLFKPDSQSVGQRDTALEALRNYVSGHTSPEKMQQIAIDHGLIKLPASCSWSHNPDGSFNLLRGSDVLAEHLQVNSDGSLTNEAKNILAEQHIQTTASHYFVESGNTTVVKSGSNEYINQHPDEFKHISRSRWYGNNTPMHLGADGKMHGADLNELRAHWGGDHGSGINLKTNCYEMSAIKMTPNGSFQTVNGVRLSDNAAQLIREGKMKFLFSLSNGTQNRVIELPIDPATGKISVDRNSELGKLLFGENKGIAFLKARFAEVAAKVGTSNDGVEHVKVFATAVGQGVDGVDELINTPPQLGTKTFLNIPRDYDLPPFIPVGWRKPLEPVKPKPNKKEPGVFATSYYDRYHGGEQKQDYVDLNAYRDMTDNASMLKARNAQAGTYKNKNIKETTLDDYRSKSDLISEHILENDNGLKVTLEDKDRDAITGKVLTPKRKGLRITFDRDSYGAGYNTNKDVVDLNDYANENDEDKALELTKKYQKYSYIFERLEMLQNYDSQDKQTKIMIEKELDHFNKQRHSGEPLDINEYIGQQITRLHHQIDNILMSSAKVGDKPFSPEFYEKSPLVKGVKRAQEIVIILDSPIGDAVLTIPALLAVQKYLALNKMEKPIKLVVSPMGMDLFECVRDQFPADVELVKYEDMTKTFAEDKKEKFVINAHKDFKDYASLNLKEGDNKDISRVMSVAWDSWTKEEIPKRLGVMEKYDAIPARIMRNFENMFGQKLFKDINKMDHYLEKNKNFETVAAELKDKYKINDNEQVVVISAGSSVQPKEYEPEKWEAVINDTLTKYPKARIMFLKDPDEKRWARYNSMIKKILAKKTGRFDIVSEPTSSLNTIMSMADVVVTPDTGLGHYASALGKPNIMMILGDPVRWSNAKTDRIIHKKARETYAKNEGTYSVAWQPDAGYYVNDNGEMIGSSNFDPKLISQALEKYLKK